MNCSNDLQAFQHFEEPQNAGLVESINYTTLVEIRTHYEKCTHPSRITSYWGTAKMKICYERYRSNRLCKRRADAPNYEQGQFIFQHSPLNCRQ
jgi:hypothetical protein